MIDSNITNNIQNSADFVSIHQKICGIVIFSLIIVFICDILPCINAEYISGKSLQDVFTPIPKLSS